MSLIVTWLAAFFSAVAGSLGLGGGGILLLYLTAFLGMGQLQAQGINLAFFIPIALISIAIHAKNHLIRWKSVWPAVLTGSAGVLLGAWVTRWLDPIWISKIFAAGLLILGLKELFSGWDRSGEKN